MSDEVTVFLLDKRDDFVPGPCGCSAMLRFAVAVGYVERPCQFCGKTPADGGTPGKDCPACLLKGWRAPHICPACWEVHGARLMAEAEQAKGGPTA